MAALFVSKVPVAEASIALRRATGIALPAATLDRVVKRVAQKAVETRRQAGQGLDRQSMVQAPDTLIILIKVSVLDMCFTFSCDDCRLGPRMTGKP